MSAWAQTMLQRKCTKMEILILECWNAEHNAVECPGK